MKTYSRIIALAGCSLAGAMLVWSQNTNDSAFSGRLAITNSIAEFIFSATATNGRTFMFTNQIGTVSSGSMVGTNLNGLWFVMSVSTNRHHLGEPIMCRIFLFNASATFINLHRSDAYEDTTGFGKFVVTNTDSMQAIAPRQLQPSRYGHSRGGGFGPGANCIFEFSLDDLFQFAAPGDYQVVFHGKLPSVKTSAAKVEFETPPLLLTIMTPKSMTYDTNAPSGARPEIR